ncbi:MAG: hypothetical protein OXG35_14005, partial [Acidobacteria bacterium]|nr:hypothetical protein [Acidobacteriota bacterium]
SRTHPIFGDDDQFDGGRGVVADSSTDARRGGLGPPPLSAREWAPTMACESRNREDAMQEAARQTAATAGFRARLTRAYVTEHARADAQGNDRVIGLLERRFDGAGRAELRSEARKLRRRYNACLAEWMAGDTGGVASGRSSVRRALRRTTPKRRQNAALMALFQAMGDHLEAVHGYRTHVGAAVNGVYRGDIEPHDALMAVGVRFYRRLNGECPGCGDQDARATGAVCDECGC